MLSNSKKIILILIIILGFILRVYKVDQFPPSLTWDEAALGYNAYSILQTGRDEYGNFLPLIFKSFGDYKPGLYVYLTVPFIAIFGLNELAVRLPSVILGSLIPLLAFLLVRKIFQSEDLKLPLVTASLLAISPWAIHFSRGAWETNVAFFEILLATYLMFKAKEGNKIYLILSLLFFSASIFTYQSAKIVAGLIFLCLIIYFRKYFFSKEIRMLTAVLAVFLSIVFLVSIASVEVRSRLMYLSQLNYPRKEAEVMQIKSEEDKSSPELYFNLFHSQYLENLKVVTERYLNYFSFKFLFTESSDGDRQGLSRYGAMHLFELPLFLIGIFSLLKFSKGPKKLILFWAAISIIPASLSREPISLVRSLPLVFALEVIAAIGLIEIFKLISKWKTLSKLTYAIFLLFVFYNMIIFLDKLFIHSPRDFSQAYLYGYKQAVSFISQNQQNFQRVIFTTSYKEPYVYYLFYTKYPPEKFQKQANLEILYPPDVGEIPKIDNIEFTRADYPKYRFLKNVLIIGTPEELKESDINIKEEAKILKKIDFLDGTRAFNIVEIK